jgi:hypothetical protein
MNNPVIQTAFPLPAPQSETAAILLMIERAARDPSVDIDKMQRLLDFKNQVDAARAQRAFGMAMIAAQSEMRAIAADSANPQTRSRYASYFALDKATRSIYTRHGLWLTFDTADGAPENYVRVVCDAGHSDGHVRRYHTDMPADGKGAKGGDVMTRTHATGSAMTYGRRYLLINIFNLAIGEDDDDGNAASVKVITDEQATEISALIAETESDIVRFLKWAGAESVSDIAASEFDKCIAMLKTKQRREAMQ